METLIESAAFHVEMLNSNIGGRGRTAFFSRQQILKSTNVSKIERGPSWVRVVYGENNDELIIPREQCGPIHLYDNNQQPYQPPEGAIELATSLRERILNACSQWTKLTQDDTDDVLRLLDMVIGTPDSGAPTSHK